MQDPAQKFANRHTTSGFSSIDEHACLRDTIVEYNALMTFET